MWPFKKKPDGPVAKFGVGEHVYLVDGPAWTNEKTRYLIGRRAVIVKGLFANTLPPPFKWTDGSDTVMQYGLEVEGMKAMFFCEESLIRREPPPEEFKEQDIGDDTPNKVVRWSDVAWKPPITVKPKEEAHG